ncbi:MULTISPECIES: cbb3-type cytochrome oxidase assembly protein CcoS [unclassified Luteimonas]|uniref:cbb3-type cytochrome oxidase assembly protein CcoS n=1 Tax=unclassified Luteimonas TaxID=2629088 RepID=UPI001603BB65|nr:MULTISPECIES: cbb3-type cytochrome oxidase assembly protein CcoS [unclassified Luteimonas]MBB1471977.1 cbb3-type cytochrome oxidase assembly protein CcoS [Luteimonas sp. MC1782]MBB6599294.1 cbb3-type cytochrome oxidase assembly protein CcoS [Luteimonas sp. MC1825]QOC87010.1 cbb3-type cytochrome oxidase assembly protein CcoS [Luteimonas sp. MC1825]
MNVLLFLIPVSLVLLLVAVWAFRWAVGKGQFENLDAAAIDILRDDSTDQAPDALPPNDAPAGDGEAGGRRGLREGGPRAD